MTESGWSNSGPGDSQAPLPSTRNDNRFRSEFDLPDDEVIVADIVEAPPALWPAFVVIIGAMLVAVLVSTAALAGAALVTGNLDSLIDPSRQQNWLREFGSSRYGLLVLVIPGQLVFAASALGAAYFSREGWTDRLGFRIGRLPIWSWPLFLLGTPVVGMVAGKLLSKVAGESSEHLEMLEKFFQFDSVASFLLMLSLISLLPGIVEELLFRGYMQRRLLTRLPAGASIVICSVFFAAAHMDPVHAMGVLPLGLWLGVIAWRADSVWPAVFGHIGNNGFAIVMSTMMGGATEATEVNPAVGLLMLASAVSFLGALVILSVFGATRPKHPTAATEYGELNTGN